MAKRSKKRRRLSMTSLIDVIFLLLLFFMLTSSFSKFSEVELLTAGSGRAAGQELPPQFMKVNRDRLSLNGQLISLFTLHTSALANAEEGTTLLLSVGSDVDAQRLTDVLVVLRRLPRVRVAVLGS